MISAEEFIKILEEKDLLDPSLIAEMRKRVEQSMAPVSAALLAKRLVDKGHLSRKLAQRLLDQPEPAQAPSPPASKTPAKQPEREKDQSPPGLAPLEEEQSKVEELADIEQTEEEDWQLMPLDDEPRHPARSTPGAPAKPVQPVQPAAPIPPAIPIAEPVPIPSAVPIGGLEEISQAAGPFGGLLDEGVVAGQPLEEPLSGRRRRKGRKGKKQNVWDSNLLLIGGGALLFLVVVGLVLAWVLTRRTGDDMVAQANEYYHASSFTKAIDAYSQYLEKYPSHKDAGIARVRLSLSRMRQATQGGDWPNALKVAETEIQAMSGEEAFATEARPELASMLPDIAEGLAKKAQSDQDSALADLADESLALIEKYLPSSARPQARLEDIESLIGLTRREIARGDRLRATVAEIRKAAGEGRTQEGYQLRRALLKEYPALVDDASLSEAIQSVSQAEQAVVARIDKPRESLAAEPESKVLATVSLARRTVAAQVSTATGRLAFAVAGGAAYGVNAADGKVLWRRDIGFEASVRSVEFPPTPTSDQPGADPLLVSRGRQEVLRVAAATGQVRWRFPVGESFDAHPVVFEDQVLVATGSGRLVSLNLESGRSSGYVQLPQALRVGPAVDARREALYQVGEHSSLFVLSSKDGTCRQVIYLGHDSGAVVVPPVLVGRYLVVAENDGVNDSMLKILDLEPAQGSPCKLVQSVRLKGHVLTKPLADGPRLLAVTDAGAITLLELTGSEKGEPMAKIADGVAADEGAAKMVRYSLIEGGRLWVADSQLTQYDIRALRGRLQPRWIAASGSVSLQPPMAGGDAVVHIRHRQGMPGVIISALDVESGTPRWETTLAAPLAAAPIADGQSGLLAAVSSTGAVFQLPGSAFADDAMIDQPVAALATAELKMPIAAALPIGNGMIAMVPAGNPLDIHVFQPGDGAGGPARFRRILLTDPLSGPAASFAGGVLAPCSSGQVCLMSPLTGAKMAEPFQPPLRPGQTYRWSAPALVGDSEFLIANDRGGVYRVAVKDQPARHLALAAEAAIADPIVSPIAVLGEKAHAVDAADSLLVFELPGLAAQPPRPLGAKCVYGPLAAGQLAILATADNLLHVIDPEGKVRADRLPHGIPTGPPAVDGEDWIFTSAGGVIWRVNPASGEQRGKVETGLALAAGPLLAGGRLVAVGQDGSLYVVEKP